MTPPSSESRMKLTVEEEGDRAFMGPLAWTPWTRSLGEVFGFRFIWLLVGTQHILKGFVGVYCYQGTDFLLRKYHVAGPHLQVYKAVTFLPWALKPLMGVLVDFCPIGGYKKWPYLIITSLLGLIAFVVLGFAGEEVLGLERGATLVEIKQKYRSLTLKYHPDKHQGDGVEEAQMMFIKITDAYEKLMETHKEA